MEAANLYDESSNSATYIPQEIITEILSRLPAELLLKLRCVCKSWLSLISSSQFINTHLNLLSNSNNPNNYSLMFHFSSFRYPRTFCTCSISSILTNRFSIKQFSPIEVDFCRVVGTCNGLLCIDTSNELYLCNPTIRKIKKIKDGIEDLDSEITYGFCYDEVNDDYKVVELKDVYNGSGTKAKVYSLRDNYWTEIQGLEDVVIYYDGVHCGICVSGTLNWFARWFILSLDMATYVCTKVELPKLVTPKDEDVYNWTLGEISGCLSVIYHYYGDRTDIWVMKEFNVNESWIKLVSFSYILNMKRVSFPIFESGNGELIFDQDPYVMVYNTKNSSSRNLEIRDKNRNLLVLDSLPRYIETLVQLTL